MQVYEIGESELIYEIIGRSGLIIMSQAMVSLRGKLEQFDQTLKYIKKVTNLGDYQKEKDQLENNFDLINKLIEEIAVKFKLNVYSRDDKFKVQKFQQDFNKKISQYHKALHTYEEDTKKQIRSLRETLSDITKKMQNKKEQTKNKNTNKRNNREEEEDDSEQGAPQIKMHVVNQQTLHYEHLIELKEKELLDIKTKMEDALSVQQDLNKLILDQGKQLDIVEDNINSAQTNVKEAEENLVEAKKHHISANKKKIIIFVVVIILLLIIVVPIVVKLT